MPTPDGASTLMMTQGAAIGWRRSCRLNGSHTNV